VWTVRIVKRVARSGWELVCTFCWGMQSGSERMRNLRYIYISILAVPHSLENQPSIGGGLFIVVDGRRIMSFSCLVNFSVVSATRQCFFLFFTTTGCGPFCSSGCFIFFPFSPIWWLGVSWKFLFEIWLISSFYGRTSLKRRT
jgi:hypothetical protein